MGKVLLGITVWVQTDAQHGGSKCVSVDLNLLAASKTFFTSMLAIYSVLSPVFSETRGNDGCTTEPQHWRMLCKCVYMQIGNAVRFPGLSSPAAGHFSEQHRVGWWPGPFAIWKERSSNWAGQNSNCFWYLQKTTLKTNTTTPGKQRCSQK